MRFKFVNAGESLESLRVFPLEDLDIGLFCIEDVIVYGEESQEGEEQSNRWEEMPHVMVVVKGREAARYNLIIVLNVTEMKWKELLKQKSYHYIISFWDVSVLIWWSTTRSNSWIIFPWEVLAIFFNFIGINSKDKTSWSEWYDWNGRS